MKFVVNTNEDVYFKPTEAAKKQYRTVFKGYGSNLELETDEHGYSKMSLWHFMLTFGNLYYPGNMNLPTESNVIEFRS